MFPFGNSNAPPNDSVSIYLDYADPKKSDSWHACSQFALVLSNPTDPKVYVVSRKYSPPLRACRSVLAYSRPAFSQMHITDSSLKSVTGVLHDLLTLRRSITHKMGTPERSSRMTAPRSPSLSGYSKTQWACYGTIL